MNWVIVASDGSAIRKGKQDKWWCSGGFVGNVIDESGKVLEEFKNGVYLDNSTNNVGELTGLEMAIDSIGVLSETHGVIFLLDSEYTLKSVTSWIYGWMKNIRDGIPYTAGGKPVKNYEQILRIYEKLRNIKTKRIYKIRSHVEERDYQKRYKEFCKINKCEVSFDMWLFMNKLNNECDELVYKLADQLRAGKTE